MGIYDQSPPSEQEPYSQTCAANGCPLIGTASDTTKATTGMSKWYCSFHHREGDKSKWGAITLAIKNNIDLYNWYARLNESSVLEFQEKPQMFHPHKFPHLAPKQGENLFDYKSRIYGEFRRLISLRQTGSSAA